MELQQIRQIQKYIALVVRRKVFISTFFLIGIAAGLGFYLSQPKIYEATTLLSYQQQRINPARMSPDEEARLRDIVSTLSQIVTSRTNLEQLVMDIGLYKEARQNLPMEDIVNIFRNNIEIQNSNVGDTFRISYTGGNPNQVARVANALATKFIEENLKYREERASETYAYTSNELDMAKEMLDRKEAIMRDYKLKYYNEMPDQRATNMTRLNSLQEQYQATQSSIQDLERTRVLVQDQIAARKEILSENAEMRLALINAENESRSAFESDEEKLIRLRSELQSKLERYTGNHPDVKILKKKISSLEEDIVSKKSENIDKSESGASLDDQYDQALFDLEMQLKEIGISIARLNKEKENLRTMIEQYESWVEAAPVREAEWSALTREYSELRNHYDYLVGQNLQAGSALNLERKQKGSQFKIEDQARPPNKPIKPDFLRIMAIAIVAGLGAGTALALGLDLFDSSFKEPSELEAFLDVELLCTVPHLAVKKEKRRAVLISMAWVVFFMIGCGLLVAAFVYYYQQGRILI